MSKRLSQSALREMGIAEEQIGWPPKSVRFRQWDFDRAVWFFRTEVTHRPRGGNSTLTVCGLDWLGSHTVGVDGLATCKKCAALAEPKP